MNLIKEYISTITNEILGNVICSFAFFIATVINNLKLNDFNFKHTGKNAIEVMTVENGVAWWLLSMSFILSIGAVVIIYFFFKKWKEVKGYSKITLLFLGIFIFIFVIWIIIAINNPILQSALVVVLLGAGAIYANE